MSVFGTGASSTTAVTLVTTAETIIITTPVYPVPRDAEMIIIIAMVHFSVIGATASSVTTRIRRGATLTDAVVGLATTDNDISAGNTKSRPWVLVDTVAGLATVQYSLTAAFGGATANSTADSMSIAILSLL